jgi:hypothetical protein
MLMKSAVFWVITRHRVVIIYYYLPIITTRHHVITQKTTYFIYYVDHIKGLGMPNSVKRTKFNTKLGDFSIFLQIF